MFLVNAVTRAATLECIYVLFEMWLTERFLQSGNPGIFSKIFSKLIFSSMDQAMSFKCDINTGIAHEVQFTG